MISEATRIFTIEVIYNGVTKPLEVRSHETVHAALEHALDIFQIRDQRHIFALYREDGSEVTPEDVTLESAGIKAGTELALRPSRVKGGVRR